MQKERENMDILFKSLLDNAEEEVPPHIWEAVAKGIDAGKTKALRWRRIALGVAVAAAITLGVFIWNRSDSDVVDNINALAERTEQNQTSSENIIRQVEEKAVPAQTPLCEESWAGAKILLADAGPKVWHQNAENRTDAEKFAKNDFEPIEDLSVENGWDELVRQDILAGLEDAFVGQDVQETNAEAFAQMEWEDTQNESGAGIAFSIGGNVQNNGNPRSATGLGRKNAPGYFVPTVTTIEQVSKESVFSIPVSVGFGVRIPLVNRWSVGTGLNYSIMERTFTGIYTEFADGVKTRVINSDIRHSLQYIGIPLNVYFNVLDNRNIDFYAFAGGTVERAVLNRYKILNFSDRIKYSASVSGVQLSAAIGFGVEFKIARYLGLYIDPSLRYYFDCKQPMSIRTQQPLMMSFEIGLRTSL